MLIDLCGMIHIRKNTISTIFKHLVFVFVLFLFRALCVDRLVLCGLSWKKTKTTLNFKRDLLWFCFFVFLCFLLHFRWNALETIKSRKGNRTEKAILMMCNINAFPVVIFLSPFDMRMCMHFVWISQRKKKLIGITIMTEMRPIPAYGTESESLWMRNDDEDDRRKRVYVYICTLLISK